MHLLIELNPGDYCDHSKRNSNRQNGGMERSFFPAASGSFSHFFIGEPVPDFRWNRGRPHQFRDRAIERLLCSEIVRSLRARQGGPHPPVRRFHVGYGRALCQCAEAARQAFHFSAAIGTVVFSQAWNSQRPAAIARDNSCNFRPSIDIISR